MQNKIPKNGSTVNLPVLTGTLKGLFICGSLYLSSITAALITKKVTKRVKFAILATKAISPAKIKSIDRTIATNIATHGVLLAGCTCASMTGRVEESAIPYMILDEPSSIRSTVFAVAKRAITVKSVKASLPRAMKARSANGAHDVASFSHPVTLTAETATST